MKTTDYIPHSKINKIGMSIDINSSNAPNYMFVDTKEGIYEVKGSFTTDSNGITGKFELINI